MTVDHLDGTAWRVRLCSSRAGLAHLSLPDHRLAVTRDSLEAAVSKARAVGATHVRTSALTDDSAPLLADAGFVGVDRLVVLRRNVDSGDRHRRFGELVGGLAGERMRDPEPVYLRRLGRRWLDAAATVDAAAFGPAGTLHRGGLADVRTATPTTWSRRATIKRTPHRVRRGLRIGSDQVLAGFVLCGLASDDGYIQRLAVDPNFQRRNVATTLVSAALDWMARRGATNVLVNTRPDNVAALTLYEGLGFQRLPQQLIVAERAL